RVAAPAAPPGAAVRRAPGLARAGLGRAAGGARDAATGAALRGGVGAAVRAHLPRQPRLRARLPRRRAAGVRLRRQPVRRGPRRPARVPVARPWLPRALPRRRRALCRRRPVVAAPMKRWLPALALVLVAAVFAPAIGYEFVNWDDDIHVYENPLVVGHAP